MNIEKGHEMTQINKKVKKWIQDGRDPRSAHWQAGLERILEKFSKFLMPGKLVPLHPLGQKEVLVFQEALEKIDLSPNLLAAFIPPSIADTIIPPDSAEELIRIQKNKPSYKILIFRPGKEERLFTIEFSREAKKPGVDIFQSGALLVSFQYQSYEVFLSELPKAVRVHIWQKNSWDKKDHIAYTLNWFNRCLTLGKKCDIMDPDNSFFHSPTIIKSSKVDALFLLIYEVLNPELQHNRDLINELKTLGRECSSREMQDSTVKTFVQTHMLDLLTFVKNLEIIDFTLFTNRENHQFQEEFARTLLRLSSNLLKTIRKE